MKNVRKKVPIFITHISYYDKETKTQKEWTTDFIQKPTNKRIKDTLKKLSENLVLCNFDFVKEVRKYEVPLSIFMQWAKEVK